MAGMSVCRKCIACQLVGRALTQFFVLLVLGQYCLVKLSISQNKGTFALSHTVVLSGDALNCGALFASLAYYLAGCSRSTLKSVT
jgi:hypothetical protein